MIHFSHLTNPFFNHLWFVTFLRHHPLRMTVRLRLLWSGPAGELQPVPYTELHLGGTVFLTASNRKSLNVSKKDGSNMFQHVPTCSNMFQHVPSSTKNPPKFYVWALKTKWKWSFLRRICAEVSQLRPRGGISHHPPRCERSGTLRFGQHGDDPRCGASLGVENSNGWFFFNRWTLNFKFYQIVGQFKLFWPIVLFCWTTSWPKFFKLLWFEVLGSLFDRQPQVWSRATMVPSSTESELKLSWRMCWGWKKWIPFIANVCRFDKFIVLFKKYVWDWKLWVFVGSFLIAHVLNWNCIWQMFMKSAKCQDRLASTTTRSSGVWKICSASSFRFGT